MVIKWAPTNRCNLNCKTCYNANLRNNSIELSTKEAMELVDQLYINGVSCIQFLGGEPLICEYIIPLIKKCSSYGIETWINTNGTLLNSDMIKNLNEAGLDLLIISIDGATSYSNDSIRGFNVFNRVTYALKLLEKTEHNFKVNVNCVLSIKSMKEFDELINFPNIFKCIDIYCISLPDIVGNAEQNKKIFVNLFRDLIENLERCFDKYEISENIVFDLSPLMNDYFLYGNPEINMHQNMYCMGGTYTYFLDADGILYPCNLPNGIVWFKERIKNKISKYSVLYNKFSDIIKQQAFQDFYKEVRKKDINGYICNKD